MATMMHDSAKVQGMGFKVLEVDGEVKGIERRQHRRHDFEHAELTVDRWEGARRTGRTLGQIVDLSAGGIRIRTTDTNIRQDQQIRLRLQLPEYAGISPFIDAQSDTPRGTNEWVGWMAVTRVIKSDGRVTEIAGRLVDMDEMDRGMLGLYLSTQPLAA